MKSIIPVVIIEFNSYKRTVKYIKDFLINVEYNNEITFVIVDNALDDKNYNQIKSEIYEEFKICYLMHEKKLEHSNYDNRLKSLIGINLMSEKSNFTILLAKSKYNYGFAIGNNIGSNIVKKMYDIKYIIFSNSDIRFSDKKLDLNKMIDKMNLNSKIALIGPRIIGLNNKPQTPCCEKSLLQRWDFKSALWPVHRLLGKSFSTISDDTLNLNKDYFAYRIIGAFMLFDFSKFLEIDMFDEGTFLYAEELIIGEKLKKRDYKTLYCNSEVLIHEQGNSIDKSIGNIEEKLTIRFRSEMHYYRFYKNKNRVRIWISTMLFKIFIKKLKLCGFIKKVLKLRGNK